VRTATIVIVAYVMCVLLAAIWRYMPGLLQDAIPGIGPLTAAYLGYTLRPFRAPSTAGVVVLGYLIDVISGTPPGLTSLVLAITAEIARATQQRIFVRGASMTIAFSGFIALISSFASWILRALFNGLSTGSASLELQHAALVAIATALVGPAVWKVFRRIDAAYARTHRERDAALEGLVP
jgi:rod shape-determining protein MreD